MTIDLPGLVARHRERALSGALTLAVILALIAQTGGDAGWRAAALLSLLLALASLVFFPAAMLRYRATTLLADPDRRAFTTPPPPGPVLLAMAFTFILVPIIGEDVADLVRGEPWPDQPAGLMSGYALAAAWALSLGPWLRLRLQPGGLRYPTPFGSLTIPWEALDPESPVVPARSPLHGVRLAVTRPDLVRRRGLPPPADRLPVPSVDPEYLGRVIRHYVTHPERRPEIGSAAESARLATVDIPG
ncbi:hypothetical protein [Actinoplanes sp. NPDC051851]|uniref:hypothetical protein n=1 Tax=Actinoplanes sp. NPDC051851 TaxID=3154753 RepID=UPI00343B95DC